ncbi:Rossmann-like and DUF2520 domain-containing protein [Pedococcus sp. 5OH_020]|uniref:Rossmann-like and DUF2520 domain-containing protein n=1 Tax=Pedococcus sp. 5OH_020 TaxID=2989814 RepID=UPI0022E9E5CE|nr:DUF2520 domain-containing protein [Pedococcus sp. 5OH_020]
MTTVDERPARLDVGVVGAGRVGAVLGAALQRAGHRVVAVSAVSQASQARAAELLPGVPVLAPDEVVRGAELVVLAVPDDALADLVSGLASTHTWQAGQLVAHTSGRHGLDVYAPALAQHVLGLALHPVMTFTGTTVDLDRLVDCCFGVTSPEPLRPVAEALVLELGAEPVWVEDASRPLYHAALAHGANHLVTLVAQSLQALRAAGVESPSRLLEPLVAAALDNSLRAGDAALTGPVARGDAGTVAEHLRQLQSLTPDIRATYVALARATAERALASGRLKPHVAEPLLDILASDQER